MAESGTWCLIESDPGVFTELIRDFGCKGVQVEELYSLDAESFTDLRPVYGLIFLFKWRPDEKPTGTVVRDSRLDEIFFAQQVIQNACATQAIVNCLLNVSTGQSMEVEGAASGDEGGVEIGETLSEFKAFTSGFDPATKGLCLSNMDGIRKVHNSFSRQQVFEIDLSKQREKEDAYHFITYVPIGGRVYELDGLQEGPIDVGKVSDGQDWLDVVRPSIQERMQRYSAGEIHFNLMAVVADRRAVLERRAREVGDDVLAHEIEVKIAEEEAKRRRHLAENARRRHNYIPFIVELLRILAAEGKLVPMIKEAKEKAKRKAEEKAAVKANIKV